MKLTPRQLEILPLLTYSNQEIAQQLGIGYQTVRNYVADMYSKLLGSCQERGDGTDRIRALTAALRTGIIWAVEPGTKRYGGEI